MSDFSGELRPDDHESVEGREGLEHDRRLGDVRQSVCLRQPLGDHLARLEDVRARLEDHHDRRQAGDRLGPDLLEERDAVQKVRFERHRHELLDLLRRETERLGLDLDGRGRELGQDVDAGGLQLGRSDEEQHSGQADRQQPESNARAHKGAHHRVIPHRSPVELGTINATPQRRRVLTGPTTIPPESPDSVRTSLFPRLPLPILNIHQLGAHG